MAHPLDHARARHARIGALSNTNSVLNSESPDKAVHNGPAARLQKRASFAATLSSAAATAAASLAALRLLAWYSRTWRGATRLSAHADTRRAVQAAAATRQAQVPQAAPA